jgi:catechol 2,3-dioxygenase-like lactoylglutathione lyase family enzyme
VVAARGLISHLDLNVSDPARSLPFYALVFEYLGVPRLADSDDRGVWGGQLADGASWSIEVRPPREPAPRAHHERYSPGIDHLAFHADSREDVDRLHALLIEAGYDVADPPAEYDYSPGYYAVAFDDPDGIRLEVVYEPATNP